MPASSPNRPALIALNGADSTNEELVHWIGFAASERDWNCLIFEGPGQWSALQLNPGLTWRPDYEVPVRAASVRDAWIAVWPALLRNAPPAAREALFSVLQRVSPELRSFVKHHRWTFGVSTATAVFEAYTPFTVQELARNVSCPLLLLYGEAEYRQSNAGVALGVLRFIARLPRPPAIHEFSFDAGWAASHCPIGAATLAQATIFPWLRATLIDGEPPASRPHDWSLMNKYFGTDEARALEATTAAVAV